MRSHFATLLARLLEERGMTPHELSMRARMPRDSIYRILPGERPVPAKYVAAMAAALDLNDETRRVFYTEAALTHVPDELQRLVTNDSSISPTLKKGRAR